MSKQLDLEDIEELRRQNGIDDVPLRLEVRALKAGDFVKLTVLHGAVDRETVLVRITSVKGCTFRGKLADQQKLKRRPKLHAGLPLVFTAAHIHSVPKATSPRRH